MKKNSIYIAYLFSFLLLHLQAFSQTASSTWSVKFSNAIKGRYSNIDKLTGKGWEYSNSIILHGMEKVYNQVNDASYLTYIKTFIDYYINTSGTFQNMNKADLGATTLGSARNPSNSLDQAHPGICALFLYEKQTTDTAKYRIAATTIRNIYVGSSASYSKTVVDNIFWHKASGYNNVVMLDGIYMIHPFLAKYGSMFNDNVAIDTAVNQTLSVYNKLYQSGTKLIRHAWYGNTVSAPTWASGAPGISTSVWSRAMGWYVMALVDILKYVPAGHPKRTQLITALTNLADGIKNYQDPTTKLWYQVVDKGSSLSGNYIETSGSAMFIYALKTAVDNGWISSATYLPVAQNGWIGLQSFLTTYSGSAINGYSGGPQINSFAPAMGIQDPLNSDADYLIKAKVDAPTAVHPHGYAAILMAASVMEFPLTTLPVKFVNVSAAKYADRTTINWDNEDESDVEYYEIERKTNGTQFINVAKINSTQKGTYLWDDYFNNDPLIFYRVKAVSVTGVITYSNILTVRSSGTGKAKLTISPNPVVGTSFNLSFENINPGKYNIDILSLDGKALIETTEVITGNSYSKVFSLNKNVTKGVYYVRLRGGNELLTSKIVIE